MTPREKRKKRKCLLNLKFWLGKKKNLFSLQACHAARTRGNGFCAALEAKQIPLALWGLASFPLLVTDCFPKIQSEKSVEKILCHSLKKSNN